MGQPEAGLPAGELLSTQGPAVAVKKTSQAAGWIGGTSHPQVPIEGSGLQTAHCGRQCGLSC